MWKACGVGGVIVIALLGLPLDPVVEKIVLGALALVIVAVLLHFIGRWRDATAAARFRADLHAGFEEVRLQHEEIKRLAEQIMATSSTGRIAGYGLVRQVEAVFSEGQKSAEAAVELVKAHAARKGANAVINLRTQQIPSGKWVAGGDAVVVKNMRQRETSEPPPERSV
jgi:hypothetical protein